MATLERALRIALKFMWNRKIKQHDFIIHLVKSVNDKHTTFELLTFNVAASALFVPRSMNHFRLFLIVPIFLAGMAHAQKVCKPTAPANSPAVDASDSVSPKTENLTSSTKVQALLDAPVAEAMRDHLQTEEPSKWSLGAGYAPILGMKAEFSVTDGVPTTPNITGQNREYLDGYVRVDSSGNAGGETTFWGYGSASQEVGGNIDFKGIASGGEHQLGSVTDNSVAAGAGFELYGFYDLGAVSFFDLKDKGVTWGLRFGAQYAHVDLHNQSSTRGTVSTFTDSFSLGGSAAPGAGFAGTFFGPNQLLPDTGITRTFGGTPNVTLEGSRHLELHLAISQWGSYLQIPVGKSFQLMIEGGILLAVASGNYDYNHQAKLNSSGGQTMRGSARRTRVLPGFYTGLGVNYEINKRLSIMANARYQFLRSYELPGSDSTATLDSSGAFVLGMSTLWKF
jgi:hypothetical protein